MFRVIVGVLNRRETTAFPDPKLGGTTNNNNKKSQANRVGQKRDHTASSNQPTSEAGK